MTLKLQEILLCRWVFRAKAFGENDCQSVKERGCCYGGQERRAASVVVVAGERKKATRRNKLLGDGRSTREGQPIMPEKATGPRAFGFVCAPSSSFGRCPRGIFSHGGQHC